MKHSILALMLASALTPQTVSAEWNDVTDMMIQNSSFDENNADGWYLWSYGNVNVNEGALESFYGWFNFSQEIQAPAGRYRLSCQAYYRMGSHASAYAAHTSGNETIVPVLYANDEQTPVASIYDYYIEDDGEWGGGWFTRDGKQYPDQMWSGAIMFDSGCYGVSLEFEHEGGNLQLGIKSTLEEGYCYNSDWCMMDNFRLEYDGVIDKIPVEWFYCYTEALDMMPGDNYTLVTYVYPANATERDFIDWSSDNDDVAIVDDNGVVTAVGNGTATITGQCDGQEVTVIVNVTNIDETGKAWVDVTADYMRNVNMQDGFDAWNRTPARVDFDMAEFWNTTFDFYQELALPEGDYRFSCEGYFRPTDTAQEAVDAKDYNDHYTYIYGDNRAVPMLDITSERFEEAPSGEFVRVFDDEGISYLPNSMAGAKWCFENGYYHYSSVVFHTAGGEKVPVGLRCDDYVRGHWAIFDNFRLERLVELVATEALAVEVPVKSLIIGESTQATLTITPANATYQSCIWSSSDESVLTVDDSGKITAQGIGTATITVTARDDEGVTASVTLTVKETEAVNTDLVINEVMSMNVDQFLDPSFNYGGWIELYNTSSKSISLKDCYITKDPDNLTAHRIYKGGVVSGHGFYTIWFDHCDKYFPSQVNFKLSVSGGWIAIVSPSGEIMAQTEYPAGVQRCSWARTSNGGDEWSYTAKPTPGKSNNNSTWANEQLEAPTVDMPGQFFTGTMKVKATWPEGTTLRYTTDGTAPTATNGKTSTTGTFSFTATTSLRLCAVKDGMLPSAVVTNTYIKKEHDFTIPVLSVIASNEDLYGNDHGIFVEGSGNGRVGNGKTTKCNWNQDWDRPCTFELYNTDGERTFMQDVDICAAGGWSRAWEPHSFKLKAAKVYGLNSLDYQFFEAKPYNKHKALQIRNGGNDNSCRFKDAAIQTIIQRSGIYIDGQAYQPVAHYINGKFIGVINMREPNNKHHGYSNYGLDTDLMDQFEISPDSGYVQKEGTKDAFNEMLALSKNAADPAVYERICNEYLDIDEYVNYMACWMWLGNSDWMRNNVKAYRSTEPGGRFHYVMFDTDGSFAYSGKSGFDKLETWANKGDYSDNLYGSSVHLDFENCQIWMNLLQNDTFRKKFIDTYCLVCGSVFEPKRCNEILDELYNRVEPMMNLIEKQNGWWGTTKESASNTYNSLRGTLGNNTRNNTMLNGVAAYSWFYDETLSSKQVTFGSNVPEATILYNGMDVPTGKFTGKAYTPVTLTACAPAGYDFKGWKLKGAVATVSSPVFEQGEEWSYYDGGSLDGKNWTASSYNTASWKKGQAPIGYDDGSSLNGVGGLLNTSGLKKGVTFYFRKEFTLGSAPKSDETFTLNFTLDDGCVVYVNGTEVGRDNMPGGTVSYNTVASTYAANNPNTGSMAIPSSALKKGRNVIAVEVHNNSNTSSDICWDGGLYVIKPGELDDNAFITTDKELSLDEIKNGDEFEAYYVKHEPAEEETAVQPVRINEVSAANDTYANEYFKRNDWIELYNTTDEEIDVAGMYISDNINKPHKYQIPTQLETGASTIIPAHGYLIVWCDKLTDITQLHASFKLAAEEACVLLTAADSTWYDYLVYPAHDRNHTAGRYPDGSDNVYLLTTMTPGKTNRLSSYTESYTFEPLPVKIQEAEAANDGESLTIRFDGQQLVASEAACIEVYTTGGEMLMSVPAARTVSTAALRSGIYIARAKVDGRTAVVKFSKGANK